MVAMLCRFLLVRRRHCLRDRSLRRWVFNDRGISNAGADHRGQPPRLTRAAQPPGRRPGQRPDPLHHRPDRIGRRSRRHELGTQLRRGRGEHREHPISDLPDPAQPTPPRRGRPPDPVSGAAMPAPAGLGQQRHPDHRHRVRPAQQHTRRQQHMGAPTAGAPRPPRRQPTRAAHAALPGRPPRRQPPPAVGRRAPQPAAAQRGLDRRAVHPYRQHGCTPMHQDGPSVSAKTRGRAVAYSPGRAHPGVAHDRPQGTNPHPPRPPP